jgi:hypothetical protein
LFENKDKIKTTALQAHALEVNELERGGMVAFMRNMPNAMMARMAQR